MDVVATTLDEVGDVDELRCVLVGAEVTTVEFTAELAELAELTVLLLTVEEARDERSEEFEAKVDIWILVLFIVLDIEEVDPEVAFELVGEGLAEEALDDSLLDWALETADDAPDDSAELVGPGAGSDMDEYLSWTVENPA